jgi:gliding motility-associated-like protein
MVRYTWNAVPGATAYEVSRDGINFSAPSSGATGLTHTITNLNPLDTLSLVVKAFGLIECQSRSSTRVPAQTLSSEFFIPNMFTPNGDGRNDRFQLYGNTIRSMKMAIFNQWGQKIFETTNQQGGWDGTYKGRPQPVGVYVYVIAIEFTSGSPQTKKGMLNLIR